MNLAHTLNNLAVRNVVLANKMDANELPKERNMLVRNANKLIADADKVQIASHISNAAVKQAATVNVNTTLSASDAGSKVTDSMMKVMKHLNFRENPSARKVLSEANTTAKNISATEEPAAAALKVANSAVQASNKIAEKAAKAANKYGISPYNKAIKLYATPAKASKTNVISTQGEVHPFNTSKLKTNLKTNKKVNNKNTLTGKKHYSRSGKVKNVFQNNIGDYVKSSGISGNLKNYLFT